MSYTEEPWSCQISIRLEFDQDGKKTERTKEIPFGPRISEASKGEVEIVLRKAQYCNMNPGVAFQDVIDMDIQELQACQAEELVPFSENVVCIDLQGPDMVDLPFIDLPGGPIRSLPVWCANLRCRYHSKCRTEHCAACSGYGRRSHQWELYHSRSTSDDRCVYHSPSIDPPSPQFYREPEGPPARSIS